MQRHHSLGQQALGTCYREVFPLLEDELADVLVVQRRPPAGPVPLR